MVLTTRLRTLHCAANDAQVAPEPQVGADQNGADVVLRLASSLGFPNLERRGSEMLMPRNGEMEDRRVLGYWRFQAPKRDGCDYLGSIVMGFP